MNPLNFHFGYSMSSFSRFFLYNNVARDQTRHYILYKYIKIFGLWSNRLVLLLVHITLLNYFNCSVKLFFGNNFIFVNESFHDCRFIFSIYPLFCPYAIVDFIFSTVIKSFWDRATEVRRISLVSSSASSSIMRQFTEITFISVKNRIIRSSFLSFCFTMLWVPVSVGELGCQDLVLQASLFKLEIGKIQFVVLVQFVYICS